MKVEAAGSYPATVMDQVEYVCREQGDQQLNCVVEVDGRVDADRLAAQLLDSLTEQLGEMSSP